MPPRYPDYPYVEPMAVNATEDEIENVLADLLANNPGVQLRDGPLDRVCQSLNVDLEYSLPPHEILLDVPLNRRAVIWLPKNGRPKHDRVAAAIGIGHWILHVPYTREKHPGCGIQALQHPSSKEALQEAKRFALALLMPENDFKALWYEGRARAVADELNVPTQTVYERAAMLDLTDMDTGGDKYEWKDRASSAGF
ncbi:ImmA/IrrE family metallo-endopeptidase [Sagittula sp. SSi028]|uniref:ImmA/IrrE family metallo-endopeptidase n=1 Tax=Sagittula sp. SSi028 TaxID=3400636 RepID=UPI003AF47704